MQTLNSNQLTIKAKELQQQAAGLKNEIKEQIVETISSEKQTTEKKSKEEKQHNMEVNSNIKSLLANTMSIQQQLSSQEHSASMLKNTQESKITVISSTGLVQQTDRPDLKLNQKLEESGGDQIKSKSYAKDDIMLQLIQA